MTTGTLLSYVETKTQSGAGVINNNSIGIPFLNEAMLDLRTDLIKKGIDAAQTQEAYIATVTVPTYPNTSTFAYPADMYILKTIEVNMTTGQQQDYVVAQQVDVANLPNNTSMDWLRVNQDPSCPLFDNRGDTFEIFPTFKAGLNMTNAIKIIYYLQPTLYTSTTDSLSYPDSLDSAILAERVAALYYESLNKFNEAAYWSKKAADRMTKLGGSLEKGSQQPLQAIPIQITGWNY